MRIRRILIILVTTVIALCGCERRPLEYANANLNLRLILNLNVKVNGNMETMPTPEMMRVMFFDPDTYDLVTETYLPAGGGRISLPPGKYKFIAYNFDTEATLLRNDRNYFSIEAYTNDVATSLKSSMINAIRNGIHSGTRSDVSEEEEWESALRQLIDNRVIYEPDHLFVSHQDVEVLNISGEQTIEAYAETIIETWRISVRIHNGQYMASARALLTGQIASNFIGYPKEEGKTNTDVTLLFDMEAGSDAADNEIVWGRFNTFGKNPSDESRLWLTIVIRNTGGDMVEWHRDITDEFFKPQGIEDQIIEIVEIIDIPIPDTTGASGGFQPGVDDWDEENIPINI